MKIRIVEDSSPDKFTGDVTIVRIACHTCKHYNKDLTCKAFPDRIPHDILTGKHNHKTPFEGDGGIVYESKN